MGDVVRFHATSRSRAAKSASNSKVTPASFAAGSATILDHHSGGMLRRCHHFVTTHSPAPTSARNASRVGQSSMIERNEGRSDMADTLGRPVPKVKANLSRDFPGETGQIVLMAREKRSEDDIWREGFRKRLAEARRPRTQETMGDLLGIGRDAYAKYEAKTTDTRQTGFPIRLIPLFCKICGIRMEWLINGELPKHHHAREQVA